MGEDSTTVTTPEALRQLRTPDALALADLTAASEELAKVAGCCEQILTLSAQERTSTRDLLVEALWTTALLSYRRCFCAEQRATVLTTDDLADTNLRGDVLQWHNTLEKLREHYVDTRLNPRENFVAGAAQDAAGHANGVAVTSAPQPELDDTTVRQTGQLAVELGRIVDERISTRQQALYESARSMSPQDLASLPRIQVSRPEGDG